MTTTNNSQFTLRRATLGNLGDTATLTVTNTNPPPDDTTTDTNTTTTTADTDTTVDDDVNTDTATTTTVVEDKPAATATTDDLPKTECSGYCKMANVLNLGMYGAFILFLLAMSYQAVKTAGKVKAAV